MARAQTTFQFEQSRRIGAVRLGPLHDPELVEVLQVNVLRPAGKKSVAVLLSTRS